MAELRKKINEILVKMITEVRNRKRMQSVSNGGETNATDTEKKPKTGYFFQGIRSKRT